MQHPPSAFAHQRDVFELSKDLEFFGFLWEQGCGKSRPVIDTVAHLYRTGKINGFVIIAPNNVHVNWVLNELPRHMPLDVASEMRVHLWESAKAAKKPRKGQKRNDHVQAASDTFRHQGLAVMAMSYDSLMTEMGKKAFKQFLSGRECLLAADESQYIKTPDSARTKRLLAAAHHAKYRRILTGTPVLNDPRDLYSQFKFLNPSMWEPIGGRAFAAFKTYFCEIETEQMWVRTRKGPAQRDVPKIVGFKNMPKLKEMVQSCSSRVLKSDVLDLPPKLYTTHYFELSPKQRKLYQQIENNFYALHDGELITTEMAIVRDIRLQQITSGYIKVDDDDNPREIGEDNHRIDALMHVLGDCESKAIVWAKYTRDIDQIVKAIGDSFGPDMVVRFDGTVKAAERKEAMQSFQNDADGPRFFVANAQAAGTGLTLHAAKTVRVLQQHVSLRRSASIRRPSPSHWAGQQGSLHRSVCDR